MEKSLALDPRRAGLWALFAALFVANFLPTFRWMIMRWEEPESYVSHGWLIPAVSAWLLWRERHALAAVRRAPAPLAGFLIVLASQLVHLVSGVADVSSTSGIALVALLAGFAIMLNGFAWFAKAWFAFAFLYVMIPLPDFLISSLNFNLKLQASDFAAWLLGQFDMPAIREGSYLLFGDEKLVVGDVCSGLRSLLSLFALGILYAYLVRDRGRGHVLAVLAATVPAAIVGNGIRIAVVCFLVSSLGSGTVFKPIWGDVDLHLLTGGLIFLCAFSVLFGVTSLMDAATAARKGPAAPGEAAP